MWSRPRHTAARQSKGCPGTAVVMACSMASDQSTQASTLSGCGWVRRATSAARPATASRSPSAARATGPVRISAPLPAASGLRCWYRTAASAGDTARRTASPSTARVWLPTSIGRLSNQRSMDAPMASRSSSPAASTSSTASAIWVSSVHSPGAQPKPPPPSSSHGALGRGGPNSYGAPMASPIADASTAPTARSVVAGSRVTVISVRSRPACGRGRAAPRPTPGRRARSRRAPGSARRTAGGR